MKNKKTKNLPTSSFFSEMTKHLPGFATFEKVSNEYSEHKDFAVWVFFRIITPIIIFDLIINLVIFNRFRPSSTIFGVIIFFYATFLVDLDSFFNPTKKSSEATTVQRTLILLLAPIVIYYMLSKRFKPIHIPHKYFHQKKSMVIFCIFTFILGCGIFFNLLDALFFTLFALIGYITHLIVDKVITIK